MADQPSWEDVLASLLVRQQEAWQAGTPISVEDLLHDCEEDRIPDDVVVELIYSEAQLRRARGESPRLVDDYADRFPPLHKHLVRLVEVDQGVATDAARAVSAGEPRSPAENKSPVKAKGTPRDAADRNLLFGILALQNNMIDRRQLVRAFDDWIVDKSQTLADLLVQDAAITLAERELMNALVERHLERHGGNAAQSLAALSSIGSVHNDLSQIADPEVQASLCGVAIAHAERESPDPDATIAVGARTVVGARFRILRAHAKGGLGEVYVAEDSELHRNVALKQIQNHHADRPDARARFLLEAEITGGLEHPGIVPVYGLGTYADGRPFYAMRFIKGDSLKDATDQFHSANRNSQAAFGTLEFRKLLQRFIDVCNAIEYAHSRGVLHRDLKPGNIMLGKYGETLVVDWGLAKVKGRNDETKVEHETTLQPGSASGSAGTQMGIAIGTPAYMSPEQAAGRLDRLGPASDVYGLGATLYYVLAGQTPFSKDDGLETTLRKVQSGDFIHPRTANPNVPKSLEAICLKAMALEPSNRYGSPRGLADDVERYLADEAIACYLDSLSTRVRRWGRHHRVAVASGSVAVAAILTALAGSLVLSARHNAQLSAEQHKTELANRELAKKIEEERLSRLDEAKARKRAEKVTEYLARVFRSPREERAITMADILDRSVNDLADKFADDPLTKATLLDAIGQSYLGLGLYRQSIPLFEESRDLREKNLGSEHPGTLTSMNTLASAYQSAGRLAEALRLFEHTLALQNARFGPEHPDTLTAMNNLGLAYKSAGRLAEAVTLYKHTLQLMQAEFGPDHPNTLSSMNNLAVAYQSAGRLAEALPLFEQMLNLKNTRLGAEHPDTLNTMNNLAEAYRSAGRPEALPLLERTLELRKANLGPEHPDTLTSMNNLALAYRSAGKALPLLEQTLELRKAKLGSLHPDTLTSMNNLAAAYRSAARWTEALPLLEQTLEARKVQLGPDHPDTLISMNNLALAYYEIKESARALPLLEQTLERKKAKLGPDHPDTLASMNNLAVAYLRDKRTEQALPLVDEYVAGKRKQARPDDPAFAGQLAVVSQELVKAKQYRAAETHLRECLTILEKQLPDDWSMFNTKSMLGEALAGQQKLSEAEPLLIDGYKGMKTREEKIPPNAKARLGEALQRLVDLYTAWEKLEEAAKWMAVLNAATPPANK